MGTLLFRRFFKYITKRIMDNNQSGSHVVKNVRSLKGGRKKSRFWKSERDRFRSIIKTKGLKQSLKQNQRLKEEKLRVRAYEQSLKEATKMEKEALRARQETNKKNREENAKKNEVYQEIKNLSKL